jgi:hypothetical protein
MASWPTNDLQGTLSLIDGSGSPITLDAPFLRGDLVISNLGGDGLNEAQMVKSRNVVHGVIAGESLEPTIAISAFWMASSAEIRNFVKRQGDYTTLVSTQGAGRFFTFNVRIQILASEFGGTDWDTTFRNCFLADWGFTQDRAGNYDSYQFTCTNGTTPGSSLVLTRYGE